MLRFLKVNTILKRNLSKTRPLTERILELQLRPKSNATWMELRNTKRCRKNGSETKAGVYVFLLTTVILMRERERERGRLNS